MAIDRFGRQIHYLRISLTDHCNLRCVYCMPEDMTFRPNAELMQDDEMLALVRMFASLGFDKYPPDRRRADRARPHRRPGAGDRPDPRGALPFDDHQRRAARRAWLPRWPKPACSGSTSAWTPWTRRNSTA